MSNAAAEILNRVATAGTMNSFGSRFASVEPKDGQPGKDGDHLFIVERFECKSVFNKKENQNVVMVGVDGIIADSNCMAKGARVSDAFMIGRISTAGETARKKCNGLVRAMIEGLGFVQAPDDANGAAFNAKVHEQLISFLEIDPATGYSKTSGRRYPGRGVLVRVHTSKSKPDQTGKVYDNNSYVCVPQTIEQVKAARAQIEAPPVTPTNAAPAAPTPAPAAPAPSILDDI